MQRTLPCLYRIYEEHSDAPYYGIGIHVHACSSAVDGVHTFQLLVFFHAGGGEMMQANPA